MKTDLDEIEAAIADLKAAERMLDDHNRGTPCFPDCERRVLLESIVAKARTVLEQVLDRAVVKLGLDK